MGSMEVVSKYKVINNLYASIFFFAWNGNATEVDEPSLKTQASKSQFQVQLGLHRPCFFLKGAGTRKIFASAAA